MSVILSSAGLLSVVLFLVVATARCYLAHETTRLTSRLPGEGVAERVCAHKDNHEDGGHPSVVVPCDHEVEPSAVVAKRLTAHQTLLVCNLTRLT